MTLAEAASTAYGPSTGPLLLFALAATAVYLIHCWIWPFRACRKCDGAGRFRSPSGRAWRNCPRCGGSPAKLRAGRRAITYLTSTLRDRDK